MKRTTKYVFLDVHQDTTVGAVREESGRIIARPIVPTEAGALVGLLRDMRGTRHVAFEEGAQAQWLYQLLCPVVDRVVVCDRRGEKRAGNKGDKLDASQGSELLRQGALRAVYHGGGERARLKELARKEAFALEPVLRIYTFTMEESFRGGPGVSKTRNVSELTTGLGALALALAALGIYGVLAFSVAQRTREIGIRMALGARASSVQMLVVKQAMTLVMLGIAVGLPCAIAVAHVLRSLLLGLSATDPIAHSGVVLLLLIVALIASWAPARRAAQVDPMIALRQQ